MEFDLCTKLIANLKQAFCPTLSALNQRKYRIGKLF